MDYTTRLALKKPNPDPVTGDYVDVAKLNENADAIDGAISFTVCTSGARPAVPFQGQAILETDTGKTYVWGGSAWLPLLVGNAPQIVTNLGIGVAADASAARKIKTFWSGTTGGTSQVLLEQSGVAAGSRALAIKAGGEANERWWTDFDGKMQWGPGVAGGDVTLQRSAAGTLQVGGKLDITGINGLFAVHKAADETVTNSATRQDDDHLFLDLAANATYIIDGLILYVSSAVADFNMGWRWTQTVASFDWTAWGPAQAMAIPPSYEGPVKFEARTATDSNLIAGSGVALSARPTGTLITGVSAPRMYLQWAQNTAEATNTIVRKGSWLRAHRVA